MEKDGRDREKEGWEGPRVMQCLWSTSIRAMIRGVWNFGGLIAIRMWTVKLQGDVD